MEGYDTSAAIENVERRSHANARLERIPEALDGRRNIWFCRCWEDGNADVDAVVSSLGALDGLPVAGA